MEELRKEVGAGESRQGKNGGTDGGGGYEREFQEEAGEEPASGLDTWKEWKGNG